jgi:hypothetical protein
MFTPTVIELRPALDVVCRDPFLGDRDEPPEPRVPAAAHRLAVHPSPFPRSQRALVEAAHLRMPGLDGPTSQRRARVRSVDA